MSTTDTMTGIHANWVAPRLQNARRQGWGADDLQYVPTLAPQDLLTMIFAALMWRAHHGPIRLFADSRSMDFLGERGLLDLYDGLHSAEIDGIDQAKFDPDVYFSLPKLVALQASVVPVAVLDLDLFLRVPLPQQQSKEFVFAHYETLNREVYPLLASLPNPNNVMPQGWDDDLPACNMAFAAFSDQGHLDELTDLALAYAADNGAELILHPVARIAFAEQRLCAYTAARHGVAMRPLTPSVWDTELNEWTAGAPEHLFHHTWHHKRFLGRKLALDRLCVRLARELLQTFPSAADLLEKDPVLAAYAEQARAQASGLG